MDILKSVSGVVLAGGKSSRMGTDKALLTFDGRSLAQRAVDTLQSIFSEVIVVTNSDEVAGQVSVSAVKDQIEQQGPLSGIHAGLGAIACQHAFFVACDMPRLNVLFIRHLAELALQGYDIVAPRIDGQVEAMHAVYSRNCRAAIEDCLAQGRRRIIAFYDSMRVRYVERSECEKFDPELRMFVNVNTPEEWETLTTTS